jgi:hypothetical protein
VSYYRLEAPFEGGPLLIHVGDLVEIRDVEGRWHPAVAASQPRYDHAHAAGRHCYLTVSVVGAWPRPVNWPAEHVRPAGEPGGEA